MVKIWVVQDYPMDNRVVGIYSEREKAQAAIDALVNSGEERGDFMVHEFTLDMTHADWKA